MVCGGGVLGTERMVLWVAEGYEGMVLRGALCFRVHGLRFQFEDLGFKVQGLGSRV